jgi:hypothetical protein
MFKEKMRRIRGVMYLAVYLEAYGSTVYGVYSVYSVYGGINPSKRHEGGFVSGLSVYTV